MKSAIMTRACSGKIEALCATLLALQMSTEQGVGWMTAMPSSPPIRPIQIGPQGGGRNFDRRLPSTIFDSEACSDVQIRLDLGSAGGSRFADRNTAGRSYGFAVLHVLYV